MKPMKPARYRIERVFKGGPLYYDARDIVAYEPTIDEANRWIAARIKRAAKSGLKLSAFDFDVVDTFDAS